MGGKSPEHEISMKSARNIIDKIDRKKFYPILIGIDITGKWLLIDELDFTANTEKYKTLKANDNRGLAMLGGNENAAFYNLDTLTYLPKIDAAFSVLHGGFGEDGSVQGVLKLLDIPFTGPGIAGASINMDKEIMKKLLKEAKIKTAKYVAYHYTDKNKINFESCVKKLALPMILKPASCGSSVGVHKIKNEVEFWAAVHDGFVYDNKILLEEFIIGQEVECAVMGNYKVKCSTPGEVITNKKYEIYNYEAKYLDAEGAQTKVPASLTVERLLKVKRNSIKAYKALYCEGLSRVDSFVTNEGLIYINEINTLPGFTSISMYPKLWEYEGVAYTALITKLIEFAFERKIFESRVVTTFAQ